MQRASAASPIPVSILTGFLGAGKTTLVNRLLKDPELADTAVIVNEFGEVAIDHLLVESASDGVIQLADGCLCCTVRGELVDTLLDLLERLGDGRIPRLSRVVVETTGLADPAPVPQSLMGHPLLLQAFRLDGVIALVDAVHGAATLDRHVEALKQAAMADRLVLTKLDLAGDADALTERLRAINPGAVILDVRHVGADLLRCGLFDPETKTADVRRWLGEASEHSAAHDHHHHHDDIVHGHEHHAHEDGAGHGRHDARLGSMSLVHPGPLPFSAVETFLHLVRSTQADRLLRLKGIIELAEDPAHPLVVHGVQTVFHPPARLPAWPDAQRGTRLVLIGMDLDQDYVRRLWSAIRGELALDTPDRAALEENPLAIAGG